MSITYKNGTYYCRFQINGERHHYICNGATSIKEAQNLENQFKYKLQQQQNGVIPREVKRIKLKTLIQLYDDYGRVNKQSYGRDAYAKIIGQYFGVESYTDTITAEKIEKFKKWLKDERGSSNSTINKYRAALGKMFNLGIDNKLITENPVSKVKAFKEDNHKIRFLTLDEEIRMFNVIKKGKVVVGRDRQQKTIYPYKHIEDIIITALQTGMRRGEIFNLQWKNIDFDYKFIDILKTKTGNARRVPISSKLMETLLNIERTSEYVFINPETKEPYTDIKHSFSSLLKEASIEDFRFHDLRHTVATRMVEKGVPLPVVKEILGHKKIETTMRYTHTVNSQKIQAIEVLNSYC